MKLLDSVYVQPLKSNSVLKEEEWCDLFLGVEHPIASAVDIELKLLQIPQEKMDVGLPELILETVDEFKNFNTFINHFTTEKLIRIKEKSGFQTFLRLCERKQQPELEDLLIRIVQRLPQLCGLFECLAKAPSADPAVQSVVERVVEALRKVGDFLNDSKQTANAIQKLKAEKLNSLKSSLSSKGLFEEHHFLLHLQGSEVKSKKGQTEVNLILFNDLLVFAQGSKKKAADDQKMKETKRIETSKLLIHFSEKTVESKKMKGKVPEDFSSGFILEDLSDSKTHKFHVILVKEKKERDEWRAALGHTNPKVLIVED